MVCVPPLTSVYGQNRPLPLSSPFFHVQGKAFKLPKKERKREEARSHCVKGMKGRGEIQKVAEAGRAFSFVPFYPAALILFEKAAKLQRRCWASYYCTRRRQETTEETHFLPPPSGGGGGGAGQNWANFSRRRRRRRSPPPQATQKMKRGREKGASCVVARETSFRRTKRPLQHRRGEGGRDEFSSCHDAPQGKETNQASLFLGGGRRVFCLRPSSFLPSRKKPPGPISLSALPPLSLPPPIKKRKEQLASLLRRRETKPLDYFFPPSANSSGDRF